MNNMTNEVKENLKHKYEVRANMLWYSAMKYAECDPINAAIAVKCLLWFGILVCTAWGTMNQYAGWAGGFVGKGFEGWKDNFSLIPEHHKVFMRLHIRINEKDYIVTATVSIDTLAVYVKVWCFDEPGCNAIVERMLSNKLLLFMEKATEDVCESLIRSIMDNDD